MREAVGSGRNRVLCVRRSGVVGTGFVRETVGSGRKRFLCFVREAVGSGRKRFLYFKSPVGSVSMSVSECECMRVSVSECERV